MRQAIDAGQESPASDFQGLADTFLEEEFEANPVAASGPAWARSPSWA